MDGWCGVHFSAGIAYGLENTVSTQTEEGARGREGEEEEERTEGRCGVSWPGGSMSRLVVYRKSSSPTACPRQ